MRDPAVYDELAASSANSTPSRRGVRAGEGSLGALLLNDPAMARSLAATSARLEGVAGGWPAAKARPASS